MEAIRKQATKLREQVARQQQAVLRRLGTLSNDTASVDEAELSYHQQIQNLYDSTRVAKYFQRNIVRGVEGFITVSSKQIDIVRRLATDCCKYGDANQNTHPNLARASSNFGTSHNLIQAEMEILLKKLSDQVCDPLRAQINGAPLEDARHLTHRYDRLRQDVESQMAEVLRRRSKTLSPSASEESSIKLQNAEARLNELKSSIMALGREASAAMLSVEDQQQKMTFQAFLTMVDAERSYHQQALTILDKLHSEMTRPLDQRLQEYTSSPSLKIQRDVREWLEQQDNSCNDHEDQDQDDSVIVAKVIHQFDAQADGELSLSIDDSVIIRQVAPNGWSEGECNGKVGWFPSAYVQQQEKPVAAKITRAISGDNLEY